MAAVVNGMTSGSSCSVVVPAEAAMRQLKPCSACLVIVRLGSAAHIRRVQMAESGLIITLTFCCMCLNVADIHPDSLLASVT